MVVIYVFLANSILNTSTKVILGFIMHKKLIN